MTINAQQRGIARCTECGKLSHLPDLGDNSVASCPRCNVALSFRKPQSLQRSWAYTVAAIALLLPANILPILTVISFGQGDPDTIMSGVVKLWVSDLQAIAAIVFIASDSDYFNARRATTVAAKSPAVHRTLPLYPLYRPLVHARFIHDLDFGHTGTPRQYCHRREWPRRHCLRRRGSTHSSGRKQF